MANLIQSTESTKINVVPARPVSEPPAPKQQPVPKSSLLDYQILLHSWPYCREWHLQKHSLSRQQICKYATTHNLGFVALLSTQGTCFFHRDQVSKLSW